MGISTISGSITTNSAVQKPARGSRRQKRRKLVDIEAAAVVAARRVLEILEDPQGSYSGRLTCPRGQYRRGSFSRWVALRISQDGVSKTQHDQIVQAAIGRLRAGGELAMLRHWVGAKNDFYEVTDRGRLFLRDPEAYATVH